MVVCPSTDLIEYLQRPGSVLMITEDRLHKFVQDADGPKEDQGRARTPTVVSVSGMSEKESSFSTSGPIQQRFRTHQSGRIEIAEFQLHDSQQFTRVDVSRIGL